MAIRRKKNPSMLLRDFLQKGGRSNSKSDFDKLLKKAVAVDKK
jgi:hypothetical protein